MSLFTSHINDPITALWIIWLLYWGFSRLYDGISGKGKKVVRSQPLLATVFQGLLLLISFVLVIGNVGQAYYPLSIRFIPVSEYLAYAGVAIAAMGIGFSIWARHHLGSNWSGTVTLKKGHTLIKTGPYAVVRHPIYTGVTIGMVGSAIYVGDVSGLLAVAAVLLFSLLRILEEEKLMKEKFGREYSDYSKRVKAFIPLVW